MKICKKCGESKALNKFSKDKRGPSGRTGTCQKCQTKRQKLWRDNNIEKVRAKKREYRAKNKDMFMESGKKYRANNKEASRNSTRKYRMNNKEKYIAHGAVKSAIRSGKMKKMPCVICGDIKSVAHHEDYSKPLEVVFLCRKHHVERHNEIKRLASISV